MKRLILMRHAKSGWDDPLLDDHDRPLTARGREAAERIGGWLRDEEYLPDGALVSTSTRTRETWERVAGELGPCPARFEAALYHAGPAALLAALRGAEGAAVLILAHQPGIGAFATWMLAQRPEDAEFARYPTAAVAVIDFAIARWDAVEPGTGRLVAFTVPRRLG